jgi:threonine synthase
MENVVEGPTVAEGVRVRRPSRIAAIRKELTAEHGMMLAVEEPDILPAYQTLAHLGVHVEPTSALVWAALEQLPETLPRPITLIISGAGLKYEA